MSPIAILSPEVLCYIFTLGIQGQTVYSPAVPVIGRKSWRSRSWILAGPWIFAQVCSDWRALAISSPTLWTSIIHSTALSLRELPLLQTQLARSGSAPLDLLIRFTSGERSYRKEQFDVFLTALIAQSARWRVLHLDFEGAWLPQAFAGLGRGKLPLLERLVLSGRNVCYLRNHHDFFKAHAPVLRHAVLGDLGVPSLPNTPLPWAQLVTYKATYHAATHLRNLAAADNLVECHIGFLDGGLSEYLLRDITLPHLHRLSLSHPPFLDRLTAPALQTLYVEGVLEPILPFLRRSGCTESLTALTLAQCSAPPHEIIALLCHTRALTALALDLRAPSAELVAALAAAGPERLCPALRALAWADPDDVLDRAAFADMVVSRCSSGSAGARALHSVAVYSGRRRMKTAGWRLRAVPGLEVLFLNAKKGAPAVRRWRAY
ncbi:hypothetical protein B0H19DRAFT_1148025 [Mycena capillaripes]|nr:hypothetical protein B0H19DRAFT_1148025 [Mycena capillaripes]